jgi:crotonobetainyl-CoA:carnitine CoA-transferase CaiB-like acyl-CoA transferase
MRGEEVFVLAQKHGLPWAPIRKPEDNLNDPHFNSRGSFTTIAHPELGRELRYPATVAGDGAAPHMSYTRRAPRLGEHTRAVLMDAGFASTEIDQLARRKVI